MHHMFILLVFTLLGTGLSASRGVVTAPVVFSSAECMERSMRGEVKLQCTFCVIYVHLDVGGYRGRSLDKLLSLFQIDFYYYPGDSVSV